MADGKARGDKGRRGTGRVETSGVEERERERKLPRLERTERRWWARVRARGRGRREDTRENVGGCGFAKRGLRLGCLARAETGVGLVEALGKSAGRGEGLEVSLRSLRRVSLAPRCRPFSPVLHVYVCGLCVCV